MWILFRDPLFTAVFLDSFAVVDITKSSTNITGRKPRLTVVIGEGVNLSAIKNEALRVIEWVNFMFFRTSGA